eukprot:3356569-Amphidinium_carterae.1
MVLARMSPRGNLWTRRTVGRLKRQCSSDVLPFPPTKPISILQGKSKGSKVSLHVRSSQDFEFERRKITSTALREATSSVECGLDETPYSCNYMI